MHEKIVGYRKRYGGNWLTHFPDNNLEIPWRQLTIQEFLDYNDLFKSGRYTEVEVEDEVFQLAVLEPIYVDNIDILPAGIISVVVAHILQVSGASSPEQLTEQLNISRYKVQDFMSSAVTLICSVFPAYKPEDVFNLNYDRFMERLAMAEKRLLELGLLKEPLSVLAPEQSAPPQVERPSDKRRRELLEARKAELEKKLGNLNQDLKVPTKSSMKDQFIVGKKDMSSRMDTDTGHDLMDKALWQHDAMQGLEHIYPEYFKLMKEGKKITPDTINTVKGTSKKEVESKHEEYINKILTGDLKPEPSKFLVADKLEGQAVNKSIDKKKKVKAKRR
jgi:hypothetical protein